MRVWLAFVSGLFAALAQAEQTVHQFELDNGLKVIVKEDHRHRCIACA
jgi:predicted Zn-dependent peptidase